MAIYFFSASIFLNELNTKCFKMVKINQIICTKLIIEIFACIKSKRSRDFIKSLTIFITTKICHPFTFLQIFSWRFRFILFPIISKDPAVPQLIFRVIFFLFFAHYVVDFGVNVNIVFCLGRLWEHYFGGRARVFLKL